MAQKTVLIETDEDFKEALIDSCVKWMSCNGELLGVGPTMVFASAAALFLYHELEKVVGVADDNGQVSMLEKTLVFTMVSGMLALMIHIWVCATRFFQYYLDALIKDSPNLLLELTTGGLLKGKPELVFLSPLIKFLRQQQPQIHITTCWFLSLCYADYVRKHYCSRFNVPYLEQWQVELQERAAQGMKSTVRKVNSMVGAVHQRLRRLSSPSVQRTEMSTSLSFVRTPRRASCAGAASAESSSTNSEAISNGTSVQVFNVNEKSDPLEKLLEYIKANRCCCEKPNKNNGNSPRSSTIEKTAFVNKFEA